MILQFCINYWTLKISLVLFVDKQNVVTRPLGTLRLEVVMCPASAPPGKKWSGGLSQISWAYSQKVRTNEIARLVTIM